MEGDIDKALKHTNAYYPNVLEDNPDIVFRLKCRKYVEMIRRYTELNSSCAPGSDSEPSSPIKVDSTDVFGQGDLDLDDHGSNGMHSYGGQDARMERPWTKARDDDGGEKEGDDDGRDEDGESKMMKRHGKQKMRETADTSMEGGDGDDPDDFHDTATSADGAPIDGAPVATADDRGRYGELVQEAIAYGQMLMVEYRDKKREYRKALEDIFSLIAYDDAKSSVHGHLLDLGERVQVAEELNAAILGTSMSLPATLILFLFLFLSKCRSLLPFNFSFYFFLTLLPLFPLFFFSPFLLACSLSLSLNDQHSLSRPLLLVRARTALPTDRSARRRSQQHRWARGSRQRSTRLSDVGEAKRSSKQDFFFFFERRR